MNENNFPKEPILNIEVPVYELPCEIRVYVDETGNYTVRKIYEGSEKR